MPRSTIHPKQAYLPELATATVRTPLSPATAGTATADTATGRVATGATVIETAVTQATVTGVMAMGPVNRRMTQSTLTNRRATVGNDCRTSRVTPITENP